MTILLQNSLKDEEGRRFVTFPTPSWHMLDIVIVMGAVIVVTVMFYALLIIIFGDSKASFHISLYVTMIFMTAFPIWWIRHKYGQRCESLGIRIGKLRLMTGIFLGVGTGIAYSALVQFTPLKWQLPSSHLAIEPLTLLMLVFLSISGFHTIVLVPIGEEILFRGFLYGWLRARIGVIGGLFVQACFFSILHIDYAMGSSFANMGSRFLIGLILGVLYEMTKSLFPAVVCHGMINYMIVINMAMPLFSWLKI